MRISISFHKFLKENQSCLAIAAFGHERFQEFTLVVKGAPQAMNFSVDLHKYFVPVPSPVGIILRRVKSPLPDLTGKHWAKFIPPIANRFMTDIDTGS